MMRLLFSALISLISCLALSASNPQKLSHSTTDSALTADVEKPFKGVFSNDSIGLNLHLDLYEESLEVPYMEFLGGVHGYMDGNIYGIWMLIDHSIKGNKATLRFTNDIGADSQTIVLTYLGKDNYYYETTGGNVVRKVQGRRLVKIEPAMTMKRKATFIED